MYSLLDLSYARWLSAEPEVVRCRRRWTVVLRRCRDARSRRAAPHRTTWQRRTTSSRSLARCLAGRRVEPVAFTHSLLCYLAASIQTNFASSLFTKPLRLGFTLTCRQVK